MAVKGEVRGMAVFVDIDYSQVTDFETAFKKAPHKLLRSTAHAFMRMGKSDITKLRTEQLSGGAGHLNVRAKKLKNSFTWYAPQRVQQIDQLYLNEYTGWEAAKIFETGGTIVPRRKRLLTILTDNARSASGQRLWTEKQFTSMMKNGQLNVIRTKRTLIVTRNVGGRYKKGKNKGNFRKNSRVEIVAYLVPKARMPKRLDFYANFERNAGEHEKILGEAAQEALDRMVDDKGGGKGK